jgi:putative Holliday junction resolvase
MLEIVLALDIGKARTGIARSDALGIVIKALKTIETEKINQTIDELQEEYEIKKIIIGKPFNTEKGSKETLIFIEKLSKQLITLYPKIQFLFVDERFTSKEAKSVLDNKGVRINKDNKSLIDMYSAAIILEHYWEEQAPPNEII